MISIEELLENKYIKEYGRILAVLIVSIIIGLPALAYHHYQDQIKSKNAALAANKAKDSNQGWPCGYQQKCSGSLAQPSFPSESSDIDCSSYQAPDKQSFAAAVSGGNSACALKCDLTGLTPLLGAAKGNLSVQAYQSYVQQMSTNHCGVPKPYCEFTPTSPCSTSSNVDSGYDAGYTYAEQYQICDPNYDSGKSVDFNDGVNAWTAANCN